jgi:transcriptional regulator with XRE-family HTH domain
MPGPRPNPTASRRALAARLRRMRLAAGKSTEDAARELMVSASKISRLENGERAPQPRDVRDLARYYGASDEEIDRLQDLVSEARRKGWWADYSTEDDQADMYFGLETAATSIDHFELVRWPGLLQTPAVSRSLLENLRPTGVFSAQFIDDQVLLRKERQRRLLEDDLRLHAILDESLFHRPMGPRVVDEQIGWILELARSLPNLTVQVVPFTVGAYLGLDGAFAILHNSRDPDLGDTAFIEGNVGNLLFERSDSVDAYQTVFNMLATDIALPPVESLSWMAAFVRPRPN